MENITLHLGQRQVQILIEIIIKALPDAIEHRAYRKELATLLLYLIQAEQD